MKSKEEAEEVVALYGAQVLISSSPYRLNCRSRILQAMNGSTLPRFRFVP